MITKRLFFLIAVFFMVNLGINAQECNLQGIVKYEYNDYIGYKIDDGAEIYIVSVKSAPTIDIQTWDSYENLARSFIKYLRYKNDDDIGMLDNASIRIFADFSIETENRLNSLDKKCLEQYTFITENAEYLELVDGSGKYSLKLPYGEYYILAKSKNRDRALVTELTGRKTLKKVKIDKPAKIVSFDFCY